MGAHLGQGRQKPSPERVHHDPFDDDVGTRHDQRGDNGKRRRRGIGGHDDGRRTQFRAADQRDPPPFALGRDADLGAEMSQHLLGMVARGFRFDHRGCARRVEAGEKHGRFDLRRGDRGAIFDRGRIAGSLEHDRTAPAFGLGENLCAHEPQRIKDAPHRPLAQRGVAVEGRGDAIAADDSHHQPRAGAGVAEVERFTRRQNRAEPWAANPPTAGPRALDDRAERLAGLAGPHHVVAFEQPFDLRFSAGQEAKQKGAMGDRFVARRPDPAFERPCAHGAERRSRRMRQMSGHWSCFLSARARRPRARRPALVSSTFDPVDREEKRIDTAAERRLTGRS